MIIFGGDGHIGIRLGQNGVQFRQLRRYLRRCVCKVRLLEEGDLECPRIDYGYGVATIFQRLAYVRRNTRAKNGPWGRRRPRSSSNHSDVECP